MNSYRWDRRCVTFALPNLWESPVIRLNIAICQSDRSRAIVRLVFRFHLPLTVFLLSSVSFVLSAVPSCNKESVALSVVEHSVVVIIEIATAGGGPGVAVFIIPRPGKEGHRRPNKEHAMFIDSTTSVQLAQDTDRLRYSVCRGGTNS